MLGEAVKRLDAIYAQALSDGQLSPDPSLNSAPQIDPKLIAAILDKLPSPAAGVHVAGTPVTVTAGATAGGAVIQVQFASPDAAAVDAAQAAVRAVAGVQGAVPSSLALGGVSVLRVTFSGDIEALSAGLRAQGWKVTQGPGALSIRR